MDTIVLAGHIFAHRVVISFNFGAFITGRVSVTCTSSDDLCFDCYELLSSCCSTFFFPILLLYIFFSSITVTRIQGCST